MKKNIFFLAILSILILSFNNNIFSVQAQEIFKDEVEKNEIIDNDGKITIEDALKQLFAGLNLDNLENFYNNYIKGHGSIKQFISSIINGKGLSYKDISTTLINAFKKSLLRYLSIFSAIISIVVICGIISSLSIRKNGIDEIIFYVCYGAISLILFSETALLFKETSAIIKNINNQTQKVFPLLLTLVSLSGGTLSSEIYKPVCVFLSDGIMMAISNFLVPLLSCVLVISIVCNLSEKFSLKKLKELLCDIFKWSISGMTGLFTLFTSLKSFTSGAVDGINIRFLKNITGHSIPIIGNFAKDGIDVFIGSAVILKSSIGTVLLAIIFFALLNPLIHVTIFSLMLKGLSAVTEPLSDSRISNLISSLSDVVKLMAVLIIVIFIMFFITIILIISTGNAFL